MLIHKSALAMLGIALVAIVAVFLGKSLPGGFIPTEDQGYMFLALQLPDAASAQRTDAAQQKITAALLKTPGIQGVIAVTNFSLLTAGAEHQLRLLLRCAQTVGTRARASRNRLITSRAICRSSFPQIQTALPSHSRRRRFRALELQAV